MALGDSPECFVTDDATCRSIFRLTRPYMESHFYGFILAEHDRRFILDSFTVLIPCRNHVKNF